MRIGIDGNEANVEKKVGISEYVFELLVQLEKIKDQRSKIKVYLKDQPRDELPGSSEPWKYEVFGPKKMWTQFALPFRLYTQRNKPDVFFSPAHYAPRFSPVPCVISIMDLAFFHFPQLFNKQDLYQLHSWTAYSVKKAAAIITISEATKRDIMKLYHIPEERIQVVYPGIKQNLDLTPHVYSMNELQAKYKISENFILFVGTLQPRKNITRLIEAFAKVHEKGNRENLQLVIVGKKGWQYEEILEAPEKYKVADKVKFLDFVPDEDLILLYQQALCFAWPSLYEGFGLPVLEAMKFGCPVLTSNVSSLPEAGGKAALYVDPTSTDHIAEKLEKLVSDTKLREEMVQKGYEQVKKFSWEKAARQTLQILEEVAKS